jgi:hypothetical protein
VTANVALQSVNDRVVGYASLLDRPPRPLSPHSACGRLRRGSGHGRDDDKRRLHDTAAGAEESAAVSTSADGDQKAFWLPDRTWRRSPEKCPDWRWSVLLPLRRHTRGRDPTEGARHAYPRH